MKLYPLKFTPILKERLWGGTKLKSVLHKNIQSDITGESWELSAVPGAISEVSNGELAGRNLQELMNLHGADLLGKSVLERFGTTFPILIKFIDAKQDLSIQLHPNDALAKERHNSFGKTEMWYVMDADKDASLIVGFNKPITKAEYEASLANNTLVDVMNYEKVTEGDTFFINTGKIHAIGAGVLLAEIQQTSDVTYRVFDFNRKDKEGKLRELHTEPALDAIDFEFKDDFSVAYEKTMNQSNVMVDSPYFKTNYLNLDGETFVKNTASIDSFIIYMCVSGATLLSTDTGEVKLQKGETVLVPANTNEITFVNGAAKLLEVTI